MSEDNEPFTWVNPAFRDDPEIQAMPPEVWVPLFEAALLGTEINIFSKYMARGLLPDSETNGEC